LKDHGILIDLVHERAKEKVVDYARMLQEKRVLEAVMEHTRQHILQLNGVLEVEGREPVPLGVVPKGRRPGNQAEDYPARRLEWQGLPVWRIIQEILSKSKGEAMHRNDLARKVYEIQDDSDLRKIRPSLEAQLYKGAKKGQWTSCGHHMYRTNQAVLAPSRDILSVASPDLVAVG